MLTLPVWGKGEASAGSPGLEHTAKRHRSLRETLGHPRVWLGMLLFFLYTGVEVILGTWTYTLFVESRGMQPELAGFATGSYWAMFTIGRVLANTLGSSSLTPLPFPRIRVLVMSLTQPSAGGDHRPNLAPWRRLPCLRRWGISPDSNFYILATTNCTRSRNRYGG